MQCVFWLERKFVPVRGGHRHLQIGQMLDIDLIPEPPPPRCMYPKCENLFGQRGRKRFIASWGLRMSHICPCTPCPSHPGYRSKVQSHHYAHLWCQSRRRQPPLRPYRSLGDPFRGDQQNTAGIDLWPISFCIFGMCSS